MGGFVANAFPHGTVHEACEDSQEAVRSDPTVFALWEKLTPLGRNEFICWVEDAKQPHLDAAADDGSGLAGRLAPLRPRNRPMQEWLGIAWSLQTSGARSRDFPLVNRLITHWP